MTPTASPITDFTRFKKVHTISGRERGDGFNADNEVGECISLGWVLLLVQPGEYHHSFILGWPHDGEPPLTRWQERSAQYSRVGKIVSSSAPA